MDVHRMTNGSDSFNNSHRKHFPDGSIKKEPTNHVSPLKEDRTNLHHKVKNEPIDNEEDDIPLSKRLTKAKAEQGIKRSFVEDDDSEDDLPLAARLEAKKAKKEPKTPDSVKKEKSEFKTPESVKKEKKRKVKEDSDYDEDDEDDIPLSKRKKHKEKEKRKEKNEKKSEDHKEHKEHHKKKHHKSNSKEASQDEKPKKKKKKGEEQEEVWRWWEEESYNDGRKWTTLTHRGPVFAPPYEPLPSDVHFKYDGKVIRLSPDTEEIMGFYAKMLDHDYTTKERFNKNFFHDWRQAMTHDERKMITDLKKCDFKEAHQYFLKKSEERKNITKEEKLKIKEENERLKKEYGHCIVDSHKQLIGNYKIEPPGLFRGRGDHPKMGMVKKRIQPGDVTINVGTNDKIPDPPSGHKWKEVRHDNTVTWLACWTENIQGSNKYVMLNAASRLKGERDWQKYEKARKLHALVDKIRTQYIGDWKSREMRIRQRAVALYFIDRLALRAGNEKDEDEADTVGCCSLRVEHMKLHDESQLVEFDFLGKDSIRYQNAVPVDKRVFKNLKLFVENKQPSDELFDRLNTSLLNQYLQEWMEGLTAKVFRTYNASKTLQEQLDLLTDPDDSIPNKILSYNRANRRVALLCNHQRSVPKTHEKSMENLKKKIDEKREAVRDAERERKAAKSDYKHSKSVKAKQNLEKKKNAVDRIKEQLVKLEVQATDKEENKEIALGTSKLNYLDPRITVAWCKKWEVPIEKIYSKTQRDKFQWALDMATAEFRFYEKPNKLDAELGSPRSSMDGKSSGEKVSGKSSGEKSISEKVSGSKSSGEKVSSKSSGEKVMNTSGSKSSGEKVNTSGSKSSGEKVSSKSSGEKVNRKPSMEKANSSFKEGNDKTSTPKPARPSDGGKSSAEKPKSEPKKPTDGKPSHKEEKRAEKNSNHSGHSNNVEKQHLDR